MAKMKARRELQAKRECNKELKKRNAELCKQECQFLAHIQENKRNQKILGRAEGLAKTNEDEEKLQ